MKQAAVCEGISHFDARIMDLALVAAIVKENKNLSERPLKEFNVAQNTTTEQQFGLECQRAMMGNIS